MTKKGAERASLPTSEPMGEREHCAQRGAPTMEGGVALCAEGCTHQGVPSRQEVYHRVYLAGRGIPQGVPSREGIPQGVPSREEYTTGCT